AASSTAEGPDLAAVLTAAVAAAAPAAAASTSGGVSAAAAAADASVDRGTSHGEASASGRDAGGDGGGAGGAADAAAPLPPPWLSVTAALQYQVVDSKLTLHPGVPKKNQMGFADPSPGSTETRLLYVSYLYGNKVYQVTVDDTDGLQLPGAGEVISEQAKMRGLLHLGAAAHGVTELLQPVSSGGDVTPRPG
ncbi:hypothetical protein Vretimale_11236, partial [Volvox reticuliferus]